MNWIVFEVPRASLRSEFYADFALFLSRNTGPHGIPKKGPKNDDLF